MKHFATPSARECYDRLAASIQPVADENLQLLKANPHHPSLHLKRAGNYWSVHIGMKHRALGITTKEDVLWFWIGTHAEYDKLIKS